MCQGPRRPQRLPSRAPGYQARPGRRMQECLPRLQHRLLLLPWSLRYPRQVQQQDMAYQLPRHLQGSSLPVVIRKDGFRALAPRPTPTPTTTPPAPSSVVEMVPPAPCRKSNSVKNKRINITLLKSEHFDCGHRHTHSHPSAPS